MGLAYGVSFHVPGSYAWGTRRTIEQAEGEIRRQRANDYRDEPVPDLLWRVEAVRYSGCSLDVNGGEDYYVTDPVLELFSFTVKRWTHCGATLNIPTLPGGPNKWVDLRDGMKQWASRTPLDALREFENRRKRQIWILERQLASARKELSLSGPTPAMCAHCGCLLA